MTLRYAYNTNGFAHHSLDDCVRILADLGYEGVALTLDVHHLDPRRASPRDLDALAATLDRLGLRRTVETGSRYLLDPLRRHEPSLIASEGWERRMRFLERAIEIAAEIDAPVVTFSSGSADDPASDEVCRARLADRCSGLAEAAARKGRVLGFEPEPGMFIETLDQYLDLERVVANESFGLTLDVGHVHLLESGRIEDHVAVHRARLRHVHLEDMARPEHRHLALGEGEIDFAPVIRALEGIRFDGLVTLELSRDSHRAPDVARDGIRKLRDLAG